MVKLKYNSKEVDRSKDSGEFQPPKPGVYPMVVESCVHEKKTTDHAERIVFKVNMLVDDPEGNGKGYGFWDYVNLDIDWKVDQWLRAIGVDTESQEEGEFDTKDFVGKKIRGRVKSDFYGEEYRPKLARAFPYDGDSSNEEGWEEDSETEVDDAEETPEAVEEDPPSAEDVEGLGASADEGDDEAAGLLHGLGSAMGLDPDEYPTWGELAAVIIENMAPAEKPKPAKKSTAKKAAAAPKPAAKGKAKESEESGEDYDSWELGDLNAELESRGLPTTGPKSAKVARLRSNDDDPFSET